MAQLKLMVLGQPRLERDGAPIELNLRKALALLVYLAVSGQGHSRDALATLLWPEGDQREARTRLRRTLHRLNEAIGDDVLDAGLDAIRLLPTADLWLDCAVFRQHVTAGLPAPTDPLAPQRLAHLTSAIELYADDFLAGFTLPDSPAFDEWQFFVRESLRQLYGQVLEQLVAAYRSRQAWAQAIPYARKWVALDRLHEPAHRALMWLYAWSGQHAAAVRQYQECARLLEAELGAAPEDETTALYEGIRTRQLAAPEVASQPLAPAPATEPQSHQRYLLEEHLANGSQGGTPRVLAGPGALRDDTPSVAAEGPVFVAREQELERLDALLNATLAAQSRVAFVVGEAGQGKTALVQAFARRAMQAHPDLIVAGGNCNAYTGTGDPYLPFREILELLTGDIEARALAGRLQQDHAERLWNGLPAAVQALLEVAPDLLDTFVPTRGLLRRATAYAGAQSAWVQHLHELVSSKIARPTDPQQQYLFEQYARVVQTLARRAPLLLILDDLQWADLGSTTLLLHLGRRLQGCRVLIVGAYRPADVAIGRDGQRHPLERVLNELQRDFGEVMLDLSRTEGRTFVDALLDSEPNLVGEAFRATLYQQTLGHPLFTIELLRDLQERSALVRDDAGRWVVVPSLNWSSLPARVEGAIGERIGRLNARLREVLQVASVEGEEFTAEVVARAVGVDEHEIVRQLSRELDQTHHLVRALGIRRAGALRLSRYRFGHILIQRYLYGSLDHVERAYQHEAIGHALEVLYGAQASEVAPQLAWHFEMAQLPEQAALYYDQTGDLARRSVALDAAIRSYQAALEQWPALDRAGRATLLRKLGECQWLTGHLHDALATFEACDALYESLGDREGAGAAQRLIGRIYWEQGDRERSLQQYHRALALLEQGPESVELARAISAISQMHMLAADFGQAIAWGERALALAERLGAEGVMVHALNNVGVAYSMTGDPKRGEAMLRESLRRALDLGLPEDTCRAYRNLGSLLTKLGRYAEARATFEELQAYATRVHAPLFVDRALIELTELDWLAGRWREALSRRQQIVQWLERSQSIGYLEVTASTLFGWMHNDLGQAHAARQILEQELPKARSQAELQTTGPHLAQVARALVLLGMETDAADIVHELLGLLSRTPDFNPENSVPLIFLCRWLADCPTPGPLDDARAIVLVLERAAAQLGSLETAAAASEARGVLALSEGTPDRAVKPFRRALDGWQALGRPYDQARTLTDLGQALALAGDADEARAALDQALSLVEALAAQLDAAELQAAFLNSPLLQELRNARSKEISPRKM
jgi:DNA-binding SARP family transcriptional activator/tetratricopeptide (TPR) repeat protein